MDEAIRRACARGIQRVRIHDLRDAFGRHLRRSCDAYKIGCGGCRPDHAASGACNSTGHRNLRVSPPARRRAAGRGCAPWCCRRRRCTSSHACQDQERTFDAGREKRIFAGEVFVECRATDSRLRQDVRDAHLVIAARQNRLEERAQQLIARSLPARIDLQSTAGTHVAGLRRLGSGLPTAIVRNLRTGRCYRSFKQWTRATE